MKIILNILVLILACAVMVSVVAGYIKEYDSSFIANNTENTVSKEEKTAESKDEDSTQSEKQETAESIPEKSESKVEQPQVQNIILNYKSLISSPENSGALANIELAEVKEGILSVRLKLVKASDKSQNNFTVNALCYDTYDRLIDIKKITSFIAILENTGKEYSGMVEIGDEVARVVIPSYTANQIPISPKDTTADIEINYPLVLSDSVVIDSVTETNGILGISYTVKEVKEQNDARFLAEVICYNDRDMICKQILTIENFYENIIGVTYYSIVHLPKDTKRVEFGIIDDKQTENPTEDNAKTEQEENSAVF